MSNASNLCDSMQQSNNGIQSGSSLLFGTSSSSHRNEAQQGPIIDSLSNTRTDQLEDVISPQGLMTLLHWEAPLGVCSSECGARSVNVLQAAGRCVAIMASRSIYLDMLSHTRSQPCLGSDWAVLSTAAFHKIRLHFYCDNSTLNHGQLSKVRRW